MNYFSITLSLTTFSIICLNIYADDYNQKSENEQGSNNYTKDDPSYWKMVNRKNLIKKQNKAKEYANDVGFKAENVIFFLGDGMGLSTITASRIYKANLVNKDPDDVSFSFEAFPNLALAKVNSLNTLVADSASSATSYLCGVKTNYMNIGVSGKVVNKDCNASKLEANRVTSIIKWAQDKGKSTGVVTTTRITDATPAATYAHSAYREWENEADGSCDDIAKQMIFGGTGKNINVILGGGRRQFLPINISDEMYGLRKDDINLIESWFESKKALKQRAEYVTTKSELSNVDEGTVYLLGLFANDDFSFNIDKKVDSKEPSLEEMTEKAIKILQRNKKGFVLLVEGGLIDNAHHSNSAKRALQETIEFEKAISKAMSMINENNTLVLVTADHSHSLTINGNQNKSSKILGKTDDNFTTLLYATGPGKNKSLSFAKNTEADNYIQKSAVFLPYSAHTGEDVPVYATGPGSYLLSGVFDQTYIPYVISYAACMGPLGDLCSKVEEVKK